MATTLPHGRLGRRLLISAAAFLLAIVVPGTVAYAGHQTSGVKSYTGCLTDNGGTLSLISEGDSPQRPCPTGSIEAHFSGGDVTEIVAGDGLVGGGDNGSVTISLAPGSRLPQGCTTGQVAKWDGSGWTCAADQDTTYSPGTGLSLDGTTFALAPAYQLPQACDRGQAVRQNVNLLTGARSWGCGTYVAADQACPTGQFTHAVGASGDLECAAPTASAATLASFDHAQGASAGIPDDDADHVYVSVSPAPGTYLVVAKGVIGSEENVSSGFISALTPTCSIADGSTHLDEVSIGRAAAEEDPDTPFSLSAVATVASGHSLSLDCEAGAGYDGMSLAQGRITGIKIG